MLRAAKWMLLENDRFWAPELCVGILWSVEDCSPMECRKDSAAAAVDGVGLLIHSLTHDTNSILNQKRYRNASEERRSVNKRYLFEHPRSASSWFKHKKAHAHNSCYCFDLLSSFQVSWSLVRQQSWSARDGGDAEHRRHRSAWSRENFYHPSVYLQWLLRHLHPHPNAIRVQTLGHS